MHLFDYSRETVSLDGEWQAIPDQYRVFEDHPIGDSLALPNAPAGDRLDFDVDDGYSIRVPSNWGEELPEFRHYEGWMWHTRRFSWSADGDDGRSFLAFGAVNYEATVWLNGELLGSHEGGYTPFAFEVTDALEAGDNVLVVRANNERREDGVPDTQTDWFNFGGVFRSVELVPVPETFVRNYRAETTLSDGQVGVAVTAWIDGPDDESTVSVRLPELDREAELSADGDGRYSAELSLDADAVTLWSPADPRLYDIELECGGDTIEDRVGFREVRVRDGDVLLNGDPVWLRGVSLHEESAGSGRALRAADVDERFQWLGELGCNFARLAHYPHSREMTRRADEEGILLWEEVPAYWDVDFGDDDVRELYHRQLRELIQRDWNRPSVALWSVANETDHDDETRNRVLSETVEFVRDLDDSRLVTAACFAEETDDGIEIRDPLADSLDVIGINEYYGWYHGDADDMRAFQDDPDGTPVVVSETGGGAKWGNHGPADERWTEEFQAAIYRDQTDAIDGNEQIAGMTPWILFDFRSPSRQNPHQRGYNRKGLLDQHGRKKQAFSVLREFYRDSTE
ncbi:glycoside hydrolase family 2 protein [Halosimplex salinum]|uniref:glycoside hydrolase family 2 protein n=1 Tax=Halosimplex salinum TaxID=1710538 RepID=UPI000F45FCC8|nr:glycoside hydrolase family 2 TIM barrel-domain containing protein [Halosimplex salinum]